MTLALETRSKLRRSLPSFTALRALWRSRRALGSLSDTQLRDVGLSRLQAQKEATRPVWDAPASWKC